MFKAKDQYAENTISRLQRCTFILEKVGEYINETITFINPEGFKNESLAARYAIINDNIYAVDACIDQTNTLSPVVLVKFERMYTYAQTHNGGVYGCDDFKCTIDSNGTFRETSNSKVWGTYKEYYPDICDLKNLIDKLPKIVKDKFGKCDD